MRISVDIWHNILWSRYKGGVFSELYRLGLSEKVCLRFFQIAEVENDRRGLSSIDLSYHRYPYELISKGAYEDVPIFRLIYSLVSKTIASKSDVVVLAGYHRIEYWAQLIAARFSRKTVIVFCDSTYLDKSRTWLRGVLKRLFFGNCDGFFCYGVRSMEYLKWYGVPETKIAIRCQAAALPHDYVPANALEKRLAAIGEGGPAVFLYVGRLAKEKNLSVLIEAFRIISGELPSATLRLVGSGPEELELKRKVENLELQHKVKFVGPLSGESLFEEYARATCLVLPSASEPWGLVVNEALSFGCPAVVSDSCGCVPELIQVGRTGFEFSTFDAADLAAKLRLTCHPDFPRDHVARRCIELMQQFNPQAAASAILQGLIKFHLASSLGKS